MADILQGKVDTYAELIAGIRQWQMDIPSVGPNANKALLSSAPTVRQGYLTNILSLTGIPINKGRFYRTWENEAFYESQVGNDAALGLRTNATYQLLSQGFKITTQSKINKIRALLLRAGVIAAGKYIWVEIWSDDGTGKPFDLIGNYVSNKIDATTIGVGAAWQEFDFTSAFYLLPNVQYHYILAGDYVYSAVNRIDWRYRGAGNLYTKGRIWNYNGAIWIDSLPVGANADMAFGVQPVAVDVLTHSIGYSDWIAWHTLTTQADWDGHSKATDGNVDTATQAGDVLLKKNGVYAVSGWIQNDIDLGQVPTEYCTLSVIETKPGNTDISYQAASSDNGIAWSGFTGISASKGSGDLTPLGKHRHWRIRATLTTTDTSRTPELHAWTVDAFTALVPLTIRDDIEPYQYLKIENFFFTPLVGSGTPILDNISVEYRIAYELFIKKVKYRISPRIGIKADIELSSI